MPGYFLVGVGTSVIPWVAASTVGAALAGNIANPSVFGLDVIFPQPWPVWQSDSSRVGVTWLQR